MRMTSCVLLLLILAVPAHATTVDDLAWLEGAWHGTASNGNVVEEYWSPVTGDVMMGMFRWLNDSPIYEILLIEPGEDGTPVMRLRHFSPGLAPWEDKDEHHVFVLLEHRPGFAVFEHRHDEGWKRLTYRLDGETLDVLFEEGRDDATTVQLTFDYRATTLGSPRSENTP
ncbi:MAG: DUF6265 family protein [Acidobacteriota bacterium]